MLYQFHVFVGVARHMDQLSRYNIHSSTNFGAAMDCLWYEHRDDTIDWINKVPCFVDTERVGVMGILRLLHRRIQHLGIICGADIENIQQDCS